MRDFRAAHHAAEDRAQPWVGQHILREGGEGVMHIMLWYSGRDAVQVSRSHTQETFGSVSGTIGCVCILEKLDLECITRRQSTT